MVCAAIIPAVVFLSLLDWLRGRSGAKAVRRGNGKAWILVRAADGGDLQTVTSLLSHGADVNGRGADGNTALCAAAGRGRKAIVRLLLEKGADVNAANNAGWTPLLLAVSRGAYDIAEMLLDSGADAVRGAERRLDGAPQRLQGRRDGRAEESAAPRRAT